VDAWEIEARDKYGPEIFGAFVDHRDAVLLRALDAVIARADRFLTVGVLFGAGHMSAVTDWLMSKRGFWVAHAEWMTVLDYSDA
jgi:hypothetical protein